MAVPTNVPEQLSAASPTGAELVSRAQAMVPDLIERQDETERRTHYAEDTHQAFADAGFYRILVPRRYAGLEMGIETFLRVSMTLARGCPSTGWMYCLGAAHALAAATLFGERAQDEIFAGGDFISPLVIMPGGVAVPVPGGGWTVDGTWKYCSGAPYATHFIGQAMIATEHGPPAPLLFVLPRDRWRRLDDWGRQLGLRGSGSHGITVASAHVPAHLALDGVHISEISVTGGTPGRELHGNPEYGGGPLSFMNLEIAAVAVGMAHGALDAYEESLRTKATLVPPIVARAQNPDYQLWYAEAAGMIATAEAALLSAAAQWSGLCGEGPAAFTREQDLRLTAICRHVIGLCWRAVEGFLLPTAGTSATLHGARIERVWRDMSMLHGHSGIAVLLPTVALREYARTRLDPAGATGAEPS